MASAIERAQGQLKNARHIKRKREMKINLMSEEERDELIKNRDTKLLIDEAKIIMYDIEHNQLNFGKKDYAIDMLTKYKETLVEEGEWYTKEKNKLSSMISKLEG